MTDREQWTAVDHYIEELFIPPDVALDAALTTSKEAGLPTIQVSPTQGKMLHLLARAQGARTILEIGTLGGYSAIWLARALGEDGRLVTLEISPTHVEVARKNIVRAGVSDKVEIRLGDAHASLAKLISEGSGPFDFVFIDADKPSSAEYFSKVLDLVQPGSMIVVDNVVRGGKVADATIGDPDAKGIRELNALLATERSVSATQIQTVGSKGYDGFALALVVADP
jgi:predicted O-methyltransferase YrrM